MTTDTTAAERGREALADALGGAYDCTRVWSAWSYGTMGPDDFVRIAEDDDRLTELYEAATAPLEQRIAELEGDQKRLLCASKIGLHTIKSLEEQVYAAEAEVKALREALTKIGRGNINSFFTIENIARKALEGGKG